MSLGCLSHEGTEGSSLIHCCIPGPEEGSAAELVLSFSLWNDRGSLEGGREGWARTGCHVASWALGLVAVGPRASCLPCLELSLLICEIGAVLPVQLQPERVVVPGQEGMTTREESLPSPVLTGAQTGC